MTKKLTLSMSEDAIATAKKLAAEENTSVSAMFEQIVRGMAARKKRSIPIGPLTRKATGLVKLPEGKTDRELITEALMEKYGIKK